MAILLALAAAGQQPEPAAKFEVTSNLVVVNVSVKDSSGKPVEGLRKEDFALTENGRPQQIAVFEYQRLTSEPLPPLPPGLKAEPGPQNERQSEAPGPPPAPIRYKDRRLIVLFFDFSSMKPAEQIRAQQAALKFVDQQITAADLVSIITFSSSLRTVQDFTDDRQALTEIIREFRIGEASELAEEVPVTGEEEEETGEDAEDPFVADDTEFNIFNTDRKLSALERAARDLASLPEKKALVYFSSGVGKTGVENESQLRATVNAAILSNVSFYPIDARGLVAVPPAGDASLAAAKGKTFYSGRAHQKLQDRFNAQQETLYSLAADTGGKALLDSNDLAAGIRQAQKDVESYYILGYYTANQAQDGRFRRIHIGVNTQPQARLDYRPGYYAAKVFKDFDAADKERQLEEALRLGDPITDLPLAIEVNYFRISRSSYFVPVAVKIPGSVIALARKGSSEVTELDFIGQVRDSKGKTVAGVRDAIRVKLKEQEAGRLTQRHLQYDAGFTLPTGEYRLKFLARENQTGKMGTFETRFVIPDLSANENSVRLSSVVWASQREPLSAAVGSAGASKKLLAKHPLIEERQKLIPSVTRVFRTDQHLYVYFEVYDPALDVQSSRPSVAASLAFYRDSMKAYESAPARVTQISASRKQTVQFQFQLPLTPLVPGTYTCQVNVVDEVGRKFAFRRARLVLMPAQRSTTATLRSASQPSNLVDPRGR